MVVIFLADGFEELEALAPIDLLRRAGVEVVTAGVGKKRIESARGVIFETDTQAEELDFSEPPELVILPGGGNGTENLKKSGAVRDAVTRALEGKAIIAAICAAPTVLADMGLLDGKKATCFPARAEELGKSYVKEKVVVDMPFITGEAAGSAIDFALKLIETLKGYELSESIRKQIYYGN